MSSLASVVPAQHAYSGAKLNLLLTAERLFAEKGIEAASLREIASAAGTNNNNAIQYHFGSKIALLDAIYIHRISSLEAIRADMLSRAEQQNLLNDPEVLLQILCLPHLTLTAADGSHSYAGFLVQYVTRYWHPNTGEAGKRARRAAPNLHRVVALLAEKVQAVSQPLARSRVLLCNLMFLNALLRWNNVERHAPSLTLGAVLCDALVAARAALCVPGSSQASVSTIFEDRFPMLAAAR